MHGPQLEVFTHRHAGEEAATFGDQGQAALAQTAGSILNCEIPVPGPQGAGQRIAADGRLVPTGTAGSFPGSYRPFKGEDVKRALRGGTLPGTSYDQSQAYVKYIRRLQQGQSGFTCYASLQMPR